MIGQEFSSQQQRGDEAAPNEHRKSINHREI